MLSPERKRHLEDGCENGNNHNSNGGGCGAPANGNGHHHQPNLNFLSIFKRKMMTQQQQQDVSPQVMIDYINEQTIGRNLLIETPFGYRPKIYCDFTATGQSLRLVEDLLVYLAEMYANTHTTMSATGAFFSGLVKNAEDELLRLFNASLTDYFVVGVGSGSTAAIEMAQKYLGTHLAPATREAILQGLGCNFDEFKAQLRSKNKLPLVVMSFYEHRSNQTWSNQLCDVAICPPSPDDGQVDLGWLEDQLKANSSRPIIGSFTAGSNVTGVTTDVVAIATLLKRYNAVCLIDFAATAPYQPVDLSLKTSDGRCLIDGAFFSPHKLMGGAGSCGVLVFNRRYYRLDLEPTHTGGGTLDFGSGPDIIVYNADPSQREKSGTSPMLQIVRTALAFQVKTMLQPAINLREPVYLQRFREMAAKCPNLEILGPSSAIGGRLGVVSFLVGHPNGPRNDRRVVHQNLVMQLFNDLFGVQGRSGCSCAELYGHYLMKIDKQRANVMTFFVEKHPDLGDVTPFHGFKFGWCRVNVPYTLTDDELEYFLFAFKFICDYGHRFLSVYKFIPTRGKWQHVDEKIASPTSFDFEGLRSRERKYVETESDRRQLMEKMKKDAMEILAGLPPVKELDAIDEVPYSFFYVDKSLYEQRDMVMAKVAIYNKTVQQQN